MTDFFTPFMLGFFGSGHCLGMCGPLVLAFSMQDDNSSGAILEPGVLSVRNSLSHHLAFQTGRLLTYGLLGGLAAGMLKFASLHLFFQGVQGGVTLAGGIIMMIIGLMLLQMVPTPGFLVSKWIMPDIVNRKLPILLGSKRSLAKLILGLLAGFMPCGLSWGMIIAAAFTQDMTTGFLTMIAFGLGTVPALLSAGFFASVLSVKLRLTGERLAAFGFLLMGVFMVVKASARFLA